MRLAYEAHLPSHNSARRVSSHLTVLPEMLAKTGDQLFRLDFKSLAYPQKGKDCYRPAAFNHLPVPDAEAVRNHILLAQLVFGSVGTDSVAKGERTVHSRPEGLCGRPPLKSAADTSKNTTNKKTYRLGAIGRMEDSGPAIKLAQGTIHHCDACGGRDPIGRSSSNRRRVPATLRNMLPRSNAVGLHL